MKRCDSLRIPEKARCKLLRAILVSKLSLGAAASWWHECDAKRRKDGHLCLIAGISKMHIGECEQTRDQEVGIICTT